MSDTSTLLSVVGSTARLEGTFDIADSIHVECEIGGHLTIGQKLVIGRAGVVTADIETVDAVIEGHYEGNLMASGDVEITATGRVTGNIRTNSLVIAKGGFFNGNVTRIEAESAENRDGSRVYSLAQRRAVGTV